MTRDELVAKLQQIKDRLGDPEADHAESDAALLDYINDPEITNLYKAIPKWYA